MAKITVEAGNITTEFFNVPYKLVKAILTILHYSEDNDTDIISSVLVCQKNK